MKAKKVELSIDEAIALWCRSNRRMGCVNATAWFCHKVRDFQPLRLTRHTSTGEVFQHVVATNGRVVIDLAPYADQPEE